MENVLRRALSGEELLADGFERRQGVRVLRRPFGRAFAPVVPTALDGEQGRPDGAQRPHRGNGAVVARHHGRMDRRHLVGAALVGVPVEGELEVQERDVERRSRGG